MTDSMQNTKKKIMFFNHSFSIGGAGICFIDILDNIDREKYDIIVYNNTQKNDIADLLEKKGYRVIRAGASPLTYCHYSGGSHAVISPMTLINRLGLLRDNEKIEKAIIEINPDIVAVNSMTLCGIGKLAKKHGKTAICFVRESYAKGWFGIRTALLKKHLDENFDKLVFISDYDKRMTGAKKAKTYIIHDRVHINRFDAISREDARNKLGCRDSFNILYLGGPSKLKGAIVACEAIEKLNLPNARLLFMQYARPTRKLRLSDIGGITRKIKFLFGMDYESKLIKYILSMRNAGKIIFFPSSADIELYFKAADVVIFPSTVAHQARPIYEAGAAGVPIIVTDFPNTKEFITNEENGFVFPCNDSVQLAKTIYEIYEKKFDLQSITAKNRKQTENYFDIKNFRKDIFDMLEDTSDDV